MPARPPWWPTKAQKERADKAHRDAIQARIEEVQRERAEIGTCTSGTPAYERSAALARRERHLRRLAKPHPFRGA